MDQLGIIQLFLTAKYMRSYFQTPSAKAFEFFNHIMGLWERPRGADAELHFLGQSGHWAAVCLGRMEWAHCSPARLDLHQFTSFAFHQKGDETAAEDRRLLTHRRNVLTSNCFKTIQYLRCWSWHCCTTDLGVLISSFSSHTVPRSAIVRGITLVCGFFKVASQREVNWCTTIERKVESGNYKKSTGPTSVQ